MADEWLVDSPAVEVDINSLRDFATAIQKELETNFRPSFEAGIKPMFSLRAPFGAGNGLNEAKWFGGRHTDSVQAILSMCAEAQLGLAALQVAAMSIANEYLSGDALAQATHEDVNEAFAPLEGNQTLQGLLNANENTQTADVGGGEEIPLPAGADDPTTYDDVVGEGDGEDNEDDGDDRPDTYDGRGVGEGNGYYYVPGDNEGTWDDEVDPQEYR
jgi:hypothetical protein